MDTTWLVAGLLIVCFVGFTAFYSLVRWRKWRRLRFKLLKMKQLGGGATAQDMLWLARNPDADRELKVQLRNRIKWVKKWFVRKCREFVEEVKRTEIPITKGLTVEQVLCGFPKEHVEDTKCEDYHPKYRNIACELREPDGISESLTDKDFFGEPIKTKVNEETGREYLVFEKINEDNGYLPHVNRVTGDTYENTVRSD